MPQRVDRTEEIQKALASVYLKLFAEIKKDPNYPADITFLKNAYNRKVYDASRQAITKVFTEAQSYVGRQLKVETFMADRDMALIKEESDRAVFTFWTRLQADATREQEIQQQQNRIVATQERTKESFDTAFYLNNAAMIATTGALAISTLSKTDQIVKDPELDTKKPKIIWRAQQDEKTCQRLPNGDLGCAFLDGQEWEYDSPDIPVPGRLGPNGTHPQCRCYLELTTD